MGDEKRVLWLDNDTAFILPYVRALEKRGFITRCVSSVSEAERALAEGAYVLVIIDIMVPTINEREEEAYPPDTTDRGLKTGLAFFLKVRDVLKARGTAALVLSVRMDKAIKEEFVRAGLEAERVLTKLEVREVPTFLGVVERLTSPGR